MDDLCLARVTGFYVGFYLIGWVCGPWLMEFDVRSFSDHKVLADSGK